MGLLTLPTLTAERLRLVPVGPEHLDLLVGLNADPEVMRHILGRPATPEETREEWDRRLTLQSDPERGLGYWIGFRVGRDGDDFAGWWSASAFVDDPQRSGIGYRLPRSAWGRGLATEGARTMVAQAFSAHGVERVVASTMAVNTGSRAVLAKAGLEHVDTWHQDWADPLPGSEHGEVGYALTRAGWLSR